MTDVHVSLFAEDVNFRDFLVPAVEKLAGQCGFGVDWCDVDVLHGCRAMKLKEFVGSIRSEVHVIVVGADVDGRDHARRGGGHRRKASTLTQVVGDSRLVVAAADPCVEAWLCTHPTSFSNALGAALGVQFAMPANWPRPSRERQAKEQLGRLLHEGLRGTKLLRNGFEYAREIVDRMPLDHQCGSQSLSDWVRGFVNAMPQAGRSRP